MKAKILSVGNGRRESQTIIEILNEPEEFWGTCSLNVNLILCPLNLWEEFKDSELCIALYNQLYPYPNPEKPLAQSGRILLISPPYIITP